MSSFFMESEHLWFRAPEQDDAPTLARWINDPNLRVYLDPRRNFPMSLETEREWLRAVTRAGNPPTDVVMLFGRKGETTPLGSTGLHGINWLVREAEWGILIADSREWGKGYGREVARRTVRYAFEELNLNRVMLKVHTHNTRGIRCYEAAGAVREGVLRQASILEGKYVDQLVMSWLRDEWKKA
ncbi:MAG: GNAT family protein [Myxococcota bacterium]